MCLYQIKRAESRTYRMDKRIIWSSSVPVVCLETNSKRLVFVLSGWCGAVESVKMRWSMKQKKRYCDGTSRGWRSPRKTFLYLSISEGFSICTTKPLHSPAARRPDCFQHRRQGCCLTSLGISTFNTHNSDAQVSQSFTCTESHRDSVERRHGGDGGRVPHVINITTGVAVWCWAKQPARGRDWKLSHRKAEVKPFSR